jgi:hypothetical protein
MKQVIIAAALLSGIAVPGASAAQQHQHGARPDTSHAQHNARPASVHPHAMSDSAHHRVMHGDSAHHRVMMQRMHGDSAHHRMMMQRMHGDSAHHRMMMQEMHGDTAHHRVMMQRMHGDSAQHRVMMQRMHGDSAHHRVMMQGMHGDSAHHRMMMQGMHGDSAHHRVMMQGMHGDSAHHRVMMQEMHGDSAHHRVMMERMHGDSAHHRVMMQDGAPHHPATQGDTAHHLGMHGDSAHSREVQPAAAHGAGDGHPASTEPAEGVPGVHSMTMREIGGGWMVMGMAQAFPIVTAGLADEGSPLRETEPYLTQPALMLNLESPGQRLVLRTTLNFEALTQPDGELTFGGWGEGFIDRRHPHTLLHEAMVSANLWNFAGGALSISAGKGFAPYGTDDPMSRPVAKYPTNHHLSQILERWTANVVYVRGAWSLEAGLFGGQEPDGPYDFSNISSFGDSWSTRVIRRFGGMGTGAPWEVSASYGSVAETHHGEKDRTALVNGYLRHAGVHRWGTLYGMVEASRSEPEGDARGYYALVGETMAGMGRHRPYLRMELATRPEYERETDEDGFFRYDHDAHAIGSSRWLIASAGYGWQVSGSPLGAIPFVEAQHNRVWGGRGDIDPQALFGGSSFWSVSAGVRLFLGSGGPMRMGSYGLLDDMTSNHRPATSTGVRGHGDH